MNRGRRTARAFSLVELLLVVAIIALLLAALVPSLSAAKGRARRVACAANQRQLVMAFQMYASDARGRAMPLAYTTHDASTPSTFWWGTNDIAGVDHQRGFVWPYLHTELRAEGLFACPQQPWGSYEPQGAARAVTSTYGYNGYFLSPACATSWSSTIGHRPWQVLDQMRHPQRVLCFADTLLALGEDVFNTALLDPPLLYAGSHRWSHNDSPTTSFRHGGLTMAAFADGHVAPMAPRGGRITSEQWQIGSVGSTNDPYYVPDWRDW